MRCSTCELLSYPCVTCRREGPMTDDERLALREAMVRAEGRQHPSDRPWLEVTA